MKCKKLVIETDGTSAGTRISADGELLEFVQRLEFSANVKDLFIKLLLTQAVIDKDGKTKIKNVKARDEKTQKFVESQEVVSESILVEFERN